MFSLGEDAQTPALTGSWKTLHMAYPKQCFQPQIGTPMMSDMLQSILRGRKIPGNSPECASYVWGILSCCLVYIYELTCQVLLPLHLRLLCLHDVLIPRYQNASQDSFVYTLVDKCVPPQKFHLLILSSLQWWMLIQILRELKAKFPVQFSITLTSGHEVFQAKRPAR